MNIMSSLQCPLCKCKLVNEKKKLYCTHCSTKFNIEKGIVNLLIPDNSIKQEIEENQKVAEKRKTKTDAWLLSLPCADNFGNEKYPIINQGYKANVLQAIQSINIKGKTVLEIGSGTCWTTTLLAEAGADVVATDISAEKYVGLESAEVFFKHKHIFFERVLCTMNVLPFQDKSFDVVFVNAAIHHAPNLSVVFKEINRVLNNGGIYVQTNEPCCSIVSKSNKINIKKAKATGMDVADNWNENSYSLRKYALCLKRAGFDLIDTFFPQSFALLLNNPQVKGISGYKGILRKIVAQIWKIKLMQKILSSKSVFTLSLYLFGGNCIFIAKKNYFFNSRISFSTIISISCLNPTLGFHPRTVCAFVALPQSISTSAGRKN